MKLRPSKTVVQSISVTFEHFRSVSAQSVCRSVIVLISCKLCASCECRLSVCLLNQDEKPPYSEKICWRVVWQMTAVELSGRFQLNISIGTAYNILRFFERSGCVSPTKPDRAATRTLDCWFTPRNSRSLFE